MLSDCEPAALASSTEGAANELVFRARAGDAAAFRQLFRGHRNEVSRLVQRLLGRSGDLEDVVQEVFLQVHRSLKDFRGQSRFSTWLYRVTVNVVLMNRRAAKSRPVLVDTVDLGARAATEDGQRPDEAAARNARLAAFKRLLERLSEKKRTAYILHELQGLSPTEIAKIVDAPVLTVRTRLFYARRELVGMLREEPALATLADDLADVGASDPGEDDR
ncbi:MAG: sigma-70 family RNA polymerase sigma factor [Polyangiaceae bacterium]|nr:sigma-70 family RNA polymerase sigma factor [Polyangiaceae bacterium]